MRYGRIVHREYILVFRSLKRNMTSDGAETSTFGNPNQPFFVDANELKELRGALESKNSRLMGLENVVRQLESENSSLKSQRSDDSYPSLVLFRSSIFAKLGTGFFFLSILMFGLHFTNVLRVEEVFSQLEGILLAILG